MPDVIEMELPDFIGTATPAHPLADEERAFARLLPGLLATHRGRYVAIFGGQVVASGDEVVAVLSQAYREHGYRPILCRQVTDVPAPVVRMPSVRVVREG